MQSSGVSAVARAGPARSAVLRELVSCLVESVSAAMNSSVTYRQGFQRLVLAMRLSTS
jgi:hypothetical protein